MSPDVQESHNSRYTDSLEGLPTNNSSQQLSETEEDEREHEKSSASLDRDELFPGDTGTCPLNVRHAIAALIKKRYISQDEDKTAWEGLVSDPDLVRSRLSDALLTLKFSPANGIALAQQVEFDDDTVPYKIKSIMPFNNVQSLLITQLVTKYFSATAAGASYVWIEKDEMLETMTRLFEDASDIAASETAMSHAIDAMVRNGYLNEVAQDRYRIMPIVGVVYTLDEIKGILQRYGLDKQDTGDQTMPEPEPQPEGAVDDN
ncbi:MAG: DUF4194 domain-containing protein [Coriobacteriales bacterium]|nr:DUF4194 domain-containing protein [Coriobacteriales bacterium]